MSRSYVQDGTRLWYAKYTLEQRSEYEWRLVPPGGGRMQSTTIYFLSEGILVAGDLCPEPGGSRGVLSDIGYDIGWFGRRLSEEYLCSKFLRQEFQPEVVEKWARRLADETTEWADEERQRWGGCEKLIDLADQIDHDMSADRVYDMLHALNPDMWDDSESIPGHDYPLRSAGLLCAIQQRFAELYGARQGVLAQQEAK